MPSNFSPMVVGVPRLRRYQAFGNLFAGIGPDVHRLDRHPTMSRHPVTPMPEADLRLHLAPQTARRIELIDLVTLKAGQAAHALSRLAGPDTPIIMLDIIDDETLGKAGQLIWEQRGNGLFTASSSGLQYALIAHWRQAGILPATAELPKTLPVAMVAAISGSCSPVTAAQIDWAGANGFACERLLIDQVLSPSLREAEINRLVEAAKKSIDAKQSPLIFSAKGPDDPAVIGFANSARAAACTVTDANAIVGSALAQIMRRIVNETAINRLVIAGGDSSGAVASALDIAALTVSAQLLPGAPLCRAWSGSPRMDGIEIVLKGGQIGTANFFGLALQGTA